MGNAPHYTGPGIEDKPFPLESVWHALGTPDSQAVAISFYGCVICVAVLVLLLWSEYRTLLKAQEADEDA